MPVIRVETGDVSKPPMLEPILIAGIVITATAWYVQHKWRKRLRALAIRDPREGTVLQLLARRYARGEIDRQEYLQKRSDILGYQGMPPRS
ncbi:MAG TPA: SHOCT domain-containing protein [Xanthobacteraceae bacterium]|nr:SHOCT domain-containing protein [Xanthobacteraceae bacterium]